LQTAVVVDVNQVGWWLPNFPRQGANVLVAKFAGKNMIETVIVWDLETVPDLEATRRLLNLHELPNQDVRQAMGDNFPKLPLHQIVCIGALIAEFESNFWNVRSLGAPHIGDRSEAELISGFVAKISDLRPQLVSFNGNSFDLPVLRYRAMHHKLSAPGLAERPYFKRYTEDSIDLCDTLASFDSRLKVKLDDLCKMLGLRGKPSGIDGSCVEKLFIDGQIVEVAAYCECDVICTYEIWLRYQLFRGALSVAGYEASTAALSFFLAAQKERKPHLSYLIGD
jgi:predicted PolB exonuclease-like 3'-5' exonuclease